MQFVKANQVKPKYNFSALVYGPTGIGKTTLALSAPNPAIIDFDGGITRVDASFTPNAMIAQVDSWEGYNSMISQVLQVPADSLIFDTVGKLLDMIQAYVLNLPQYKSKNLKKPSIQAFGDIRLEFVGFLRGILLAGKNVIFVAQEVETVEKDSKGNDFRYHQPSCGSDKNRTTILQDLDLVGYMHKEDGKTVIEFDPETEHYGKNTCGIPPKVEIARYDGAADNILFQWVRDLFIQRQKDNIDKAPYFAQVAELRKKVNDIQDAAGANDFCKSVKDVQWLLDAKAKIIADLNNRIQELGLQYDQNTKSYV